MKIELNLLDNGLDFIIEELKPTTQLFGFDSTENSWKYIILNVFSGIQLILKERLKQEHWSLIFEDVSNANEQKFIQGDFVSVNYNNLIKRLKGISNISINEKSFNELRKLRNKFEHFEITIEIDVCKHIIANSVRELIIFWNDNIFDINIEQNQKFSSIKSMISEFEIYVDIMLLKNKNKIENIIKSKNGILIHCKECSNHSFMIYKDTKKEFECFVCEYKILKKEFIKVTREMEFKQTKSRFPFINYNEKCPHCNGNRIRITPPHKKREEFQEYYFCTDCLYTETQSDIISRKI